MTQREFYVDLSVNLKLIAERSTPEIATILAMLRWAIDNRALDDTKASYWWMKCANERLSRLIKGANIARIPEANHGQVQQPERPQA